MNSERLRNPVPGLAAEDVPGYKQAMHEESLLPELHCLLDEAGFTVPGDQCTRLAQYLELLLRWNSVMNLTGFRHLEDIVRKLILDSFHLEHFLNSLLLPVAPRTYDLGAGAGLPGIPLRVLWQQGDYSLVEAREKRALFLQTALAHLTLPRTRAIRARVEDFLAEHDTADLILSRAFMPWRKLLALLSGKLAPNGAVVFMMLEPAPSADAVPRGWRVCAGHRYTLPSGERYFWAFQEAGHER